MPSTANSPNSLLCEACVETLDDALRAERLGAQRIELCADLDADGLTPPSELVDACLRRLAIPLMVMVRPRGGDFVYAADEIARMAADIVHFRSLGVAGVVLGVLDAQRRVDIDATRRLAQLASPLDVTFHKAIDAARDVLEGLRALREVPEITRVLSSGGQATAWQGRDVLRAMHALAGPRIAIIAAGKVSAANRQRIADYTGVREVHGRRVVEAESAVG
jgi:copper homeostasis protein